MSGWRESLDAELLSFLRTQRPEAVELVGWEDTVGVGGYCETCSYSQVEIHFEYRTAAGEVGTYEHEGTFADLMKRLAVRL